MIYPVRKHVASLRPSLDVRPPNPHPNTPSPKQIGVAIEPPSAMLEGKMERDDKIYLDVRERYFKSSELDVRPIVGVPPDLGVLDIGPTKEGEAVVRFYINEFGSVDWMEIEESSLPEAMVEHLHLQQKLLRFTPGRKAGLDVKSIIVFKIKLAREPNKILPDPASTQSLTPSK